MTTLDGTWLYGYDANGQLTGVTYPDGHVVSYVYDAAGNRTAVTDAGVTTSYTTNSMNEYTAVGGATYTFDADGNMTSKTEGGVTTIYTYDIENRLIGVTTPTDTWTYSYDAFGNRIASTHNGVTTNYVIDPAGLGNVAAEYDGSGNLVARYDDGYGLVSRTDAAGAAAYYTFSAIGNTSELTNSAGSVLNTYSYDPFGISLSKSETVPNPFEFVGEYGVMDEGNGLEFMRARYYQSELGRFASPDPAGVNGGFGLYIYCGNNPVNLIDSSGLAASSYEQRWKQAGGGDEYASMFREADNLSQYNQRAVEKGLPIAVNTVVGGLEGALKLAKANPKGFLDWLDALSRLRKDPKFRSDR